MAQRLTGPPWWRGSAAVALVVSAGLAAAGCSNGDALGLARKACVHVQRSLVLSRQAAVISDPAQRQAQSAAALVELRKALPLAATAAGEAPQWQALMTTLSESDHIPEPLLATALEQQCADAVNGGLPAPPATSSTIASSSTAPATPSTLPTVGR